MEGTGGGGGSSGAGGGTSSAGGGSAGGSGGSGGSGGGAFVDAGQLTRDELAAALAELECRCELDRGRLLPAEVAACVAEREAGLLGLAVARLDAGQARYDGFGAKRCAEQAALSDCRTNCFSAAYPPAGVAGTACSTDEHCGAGFQCPNAVGQCTACVAQRGLGEPCDPTFTCDPAWDGKQETIRCHSEDGGSRCGLVSPRLGESCSDNRSCAQDAGAATCRDGWCRTPPRLGESCLGVACGEGSCKYDAGAATCISGAPSGAPCTWGVDCASYLCATPPDGGARRCVDPGGGCATSAGSVACMGGACLLQADLGHGVCFGELAAPNGVQCASDNDCSSGCPPSIDGGVRRCGPTPEGAPCDDGSGCGRGQRCYVHAGGVELCLTSAGSGAACVDLPDSLRGNCVGANSDYCWQGVCLAVPNGAVATGGLCGTSAHCARADYCATSGYRCTPRYDAGTPCTSSEQCAIGDGCFGVNGSRCAPLGGDGAPCFPLNLGRECRATFACVDQRDGGAACRPRLPIGGNCGPLGVLGLCRDGYCEDGGTCAARRAPGATCTAYDQCATSCRARDGGERLPADGGVCTATCP